MLPLPTAHCPPLPTQDFTILILIAAGSASLALEALVNGGGEGGEGGEPNWIEGASILAAGALSSCCCCSFAERPGRTLAVCLSACTTACWGCRPLGYTHTRTYAQHTTCAFPPSQIHTLWASRLAAVCVVVLVGTVNNYQKEAQFRALQDASNDAKVMSARERQERGRGKQVQGLQAPLPNSGPSLSLIVATLAAAVGAPAPVWGGDPTRPNPSSP